MSHVIRIFNNSIQIFDLLKCFMKFEDDEKLTPSRYMKEVGMTVDERLKFLNERSRKQRIGRHNKLWTIPDIVVFQNFETHVAYTTTISIMHQKQHPVRIKVIPELNSCFRLKELPGNVYSKLAPGTPHKMILDFYSEEHRDYSCVIRFEAGEDMVELPVVAFATRPIITFPDEIVMTETVVNISSDKKVFMRNMGKSSVVFKLIAESPFNVCPRSGIIEPNEVLDVKISYKTFRVEKNVSDLIISFDGVDLYATLKCEAKNCEIYLDRTFLHFEDTFLGLQRCISFNLINKSEYAMKYQWKEFKTKYDDMERCKQFHSLLEDFNEYEVLRNIQDENPNITDADLHKTLLKRIYEDELDEFDSTDQFLFHNTNFKFSEKSGFIGPHSMVNIEVVFEPDKAEHFTSIAFLDVTGRETRQPLKMIGTGLGPEVSLNFKVLDVENLYLCAKHQYEVVARNDGNIPATLQYCHKSMDFGGLMSCSPDEIHIKPGKCERMVLEFSSTVQGKFLETLRFRITESGEYLNCVFQGNVVCPLLSYNIEEINFGVVAFGFPIEKEISINNTTEVPIEFKIVVLKDGTNEAITWVNFSRNHDANSVSRTPKEFSICPEEAMVAGNSSIAIKITLVPNKVQKCSTFLHTYMWGSKKHFVELPIYYNCLAPTVECSPAKIDIRYCFINCPYDRMFTIKNISQVPGYILCNNKDEDDLGLSCKLSLRESYIEPDEEITIHLEIKGLELGLHNKALNFTIFGTEPKDLCKLTCDVQGPVICVNPEDIKFGYVPLLKWHSRTLNVMNDSPVPAYISVRVANSTFHVNPNEFKLEASEKLEVDISIYLTSVAKYTGVLILNIVNSLDPLKVPVSAFGVGSCILFEPILEPMYDMGTLMTHNTFNVPFKMTNMGKDLQKFIFSMVKDMRSMKEDTPLMRGYPFMIDPNQYDLQAKEQKTAFVQVRHTTPGYTDATYYCYALDKSSKFTKMFEVTFTAFFEDPVLVLSKPALTFRMDVTVDKTESHLQEKYTVTNDSYLALDINVTLNPPFYVMDSTGSETSTLCANVASREDFSFLVGFVPPSTAKTCTTSNGSMKIGFKLHPKVFTIPVIGKVRYPTLFTYPEAIKNQHIAPMAHCSKELIIKNDSPLIVAFRYEWEVTSYVLEKLTTPRRNLSAIESSYTWNLRKFDEIGDWEATAEEEDNNRIIQELVREEDEPHVTRLPSLPNIYQMILENIRVPHMSSDVMKKLLYLTKYCLLPIIQHSSYEDEDFLRIIENIPHSKPRINDAMLNITPFQGCLQPYECSLVNFYIRPPPQSLLKATVRCQVLGGEEGTIDISAVCGDISYDLDKTEVNFGTQLFYEFLEEDVILINTGHVRFEYAVLDDTNYPKTKIMFDSTTVGLLTVSPNMGYLEPECAVSFHIKYYPGVTGKFDESFILEIGYLGPISIQVKGVAVYSQLHVMLPRPSLYEVAGSEMCYIAIGNLSKEQMDLHLDMKDVPEDSKFDSITSEILQKEDWFIVEHDDENVPSLIDIDMAIERMIGYEFLQNNPQIYGDRSSLKRRHFCIPNYIVPSYDLDFGNVRRDGQYEQNISVYNYGPSVSLLKLFISDHKLLENKGLTVELHCQKIKNKEFGILNVKFKPEVKGVTSTQPFISETVHIEVNQGARIPIKINASVGIPTTELSVQCMDFCGVVVGNCKRRTICLHNVGFVEAKWSCAIDNPIFFVRQREGLLAAGESEEVHVYFEPKTKGPRQGVMAFTIEGNSEDLTAYLNGYGREPSFVLKESIVQFPPVLQYSPQLEETFLIQNTSSFPTEVFLCDYDNQIALHERICNVFWKQMNAKKVYVARSNFGSTPSDIYKVLYKTLLLEKLRKEKSFTELMKVSKTDVRGSTSSVEHFLDALELYTTSSFMRRKPSQDIFIDPEVDDDSNIVERKTKIIVFHGNKFTDYLKAANYTSRMLKIPRYSLDGMIVDILVENKTAFTKEVNQILEDAYLVRMSPDDCMCRESVIEDETEEIWRKLNAIITLDPIIKPKEGKSKETKEKGEKIDRLSNASSKMSKKTNSMNMADTLQGIPEEMLVQILSDKIDQIDQMILDSLESIFLPNVQVALKCLLKAAKDVTCVYFVFFTCTLDEHTHLLREEKNQNDAREAARRRALYKRLLEMDDYSSLTEEESGILNEILEEKKKRSFEKRLELRERIQVDLTQNNRTKKADNLKSFWVNLDNSYSRIQHSKTHMKPIKITDSSQHQPSVAVLGRESRGSKETKSVKGKSPRKEKTKGDADKTDDTAFYFYQYDIILSQLLFLLDHWDRKVLEMDEDFPNFASLMATNRKDAKYTTKEFQKKTIKGKSKSMSTILDVNEEINQNEKIINTSFNPHMGYPVWLINQAHLKRSGNIIEPIMNLLKSMITINCLTTPQKVCNDTEILYTVLTKPGPRKCKENLGVFDLVKIGHKEEILAETSQMQLVDEDLQKSLLSNATLTPIPKKKAKKKRTTLSPTPSEVVQPASLSARFIQEPGNIQEVTIVFKPLYCGTFKCSYTFEVVGTYHKEKVVVEACCDYPRIDTSPYTLFPHHVQTIDSKTMFLNGVYIISQSTLDFGNILLVPKHLLEMKSSISLLNTSRLLCQISITFKNEEDIFYCDENQKYIEIKPGRQHVLTIYAKPPEEGPFKDSLLIAVKNNPRVEEVFLSCFACPLKFQVLPKIVNFNKVILGKTESENIVITNKTAVMVYFEFESNATSEFRISILNGYLDPCSSMVVTVTFVPDVIGEIKESIVLKVFDKEKQYPEPIYSEVLTVSAEVATFPLEYATSIDLGLVKGKIPHYFTFTIKNTGKYDVKIVLTKPNYQGYAVIYGEFFKMKHMEYVVQGESSYSNNCRFICDKEVSFTDCPVVHVTILDNYRNSAIDYFTFKASARVTLSKFELCPHGEYFFGYQCVNTSRSSLLTLKNVGDFDFKFTVMTPDMVEEQALRKRSKRVANQGIEKERVSSIPSVTEGLVISDKKSSDKSSRSTANSNKKGKLKAKSKSGMTVLEEITTGTFTISPATGVVQPDQSVSITIDSRPAGCEKYTESIIFFVSEPSFEDRKGRPMNLHVEGTEPMVTFDDHSFMFPLQYVVENLEDIPYIGENFVFETSKLLLHFGMVSLNKSVSTKFRVPNTGHVTATVHFEIKEKDCCFNVGSKTIDISPYKSEFNVLEFSPKSIGIWTGTLEMKCRSFSSGKEISSKINLIGEACMPTIEILEPDYKKNTDLCFGPIPVKNSCARTVVIRNNGQVPCRVVVEIAGDPDWCLSLTLQNESGEMDLDLERCDKKHSDVMTLQKGQKGFINILFESKYSTRIDADLNFIVINNCFDVWKLHLFTFSFDVPVCLDDLPVNLLQDKTIAYALNFGSVDLNDQYKIRFKIRNLSDAIYRFHFCQIHELILSPSVGHLYEGSEKTIIAALRTKRHIDFEEMDIHLTVIEIKLNPGCIFPLPWDNRQDPKIAYFEPKLIAESAEPEVPCIEDAKYESNEPPYETVGRSSVIPLVLNAQCGYAEYFCEPLEILFPPTYINSVFTQTTNVENRSKVNLEISWTMEKQENTETVPTTPKPSLFEKMQLSEGAFTSHRTSLREANAFSIEPVTYVIPPEEHKEFKISFSPSDTVLHRYVLKANMKNLDPESEDLEIEVKGEGLSCPYYLSSDFMEEFEASDCRFRTYCGLPANMDTKILKFLSLGMGSECNRALYVRNSTHKPFSFVWRNGRIDNEESSFFYCEFNKGYVTPGKITKTNFVFMPRMHGEFSDYFQFIPDDPFIPKCSLLLQGICREPKVYFENASLSLGATLLNNLVQEKMILRNDEDIRICFSFKKNSLFSDNQQMMNISPMSGTMEPRSKNKIRISVRNNKEGESVFSPRCMVQYMSEPLHFNLLMTVVDVSAKLVLFGRDLSRIDVKPNKPKTISLGVIVPHKREDIRFELENTSTIGYYYCWLIEDKQMKTKIRFSRKEGYLKSSERINFTASILAVRKCLLRNIILKLKILFGPTYIFYVEASSQRPKFTFSFLKFDFAKCLIQKEPTKFYHAALVFKNNNEWPVVFEYVKHNIQAFFVDFKSSVVAPEEMKTVDIYFSPTEQLVYETSINFFVDSQKVIIKLSGEGVPLDIELLNLADKFLDFGKVRVGKCVQKSIKVLNASETSVDIVFALSSKLPQNLKKIEKDEEEYCIEHARLPPTPEENNANQKPKVNKKKGKEKEEKKEEKSSFIKDEKVMKMSSKDKLTKVNRKKSDMSNLIMKSIEKLQTDSEMRVINAKEVLDRFLSESVDISPKKIMKILPNKTADVIIKFKPMEIKEKFHSNIYFQVQNHTEPILTIMGSAVDASFALNKDVINFGNVVVGYNSEERIILINDGVIGGKFRWYLEKNSNYISFIGGEGYSPPNSKVTTNIIFKPGHVQCVFKFKAYCEIENYKKRLEVILSGGSMNLPAPLETLQFTAAVREEAFQPIEFKNDTKDTWNTEPVFTGNYFSGANILRVPKESSIIYQVVYAPMKLYPSQHKGTVFFPLPNGMNSLYALEGTVTHPNPVAEISREICCKTYHSEVLKVENWLGLRQQFRVISEVLDGSSTRMIYKITSNDFIEVPPYGKRDFKWTIYVVNDGKLSFKVTFLNEKTKEFLHYVIILKISPLELGIDNIEFVTCVRIPAIKKIIVKNPLPEAVDYNVTSSSPYVMTNSYFTAQPHEKYNLTVTYLPVKVESTTAVLTISNPIVGNYNYNLMLEAQPPNSEKEVHFSAQFGQSKSKTIQLAAILQNSEAVAKITDDASFDVLKLNCFSDKPTVDVLFFPSKIGISRTSLLISSFLGEYTYPLVGECLPAEPKGPFLIAAGESVNIEISNPFGDTRVFQFSVDNPIFNVKPSEDAIKPKKSTKIAVSVLGKRAGKVGSSTRLSEFFRTGIVTGKLSVVCDEEEHTWIYYLQCPSAIK